MNRNIVIVYHSGYGHTKKVAEAVADGSAGTLLSIDAEGNLPEGGWEQLAAAGFGDSLGDFGRVAVAAVVNDDDGVHGG